MSKYVNVLLSRNTDRLFSYSVPSDLEDTIDIGKTVVVPFRNKVMNAFVVEYVPRPPYDVIKDVQSVLDEIPIFSKENVALSYQLASHYMCNFLTALNLFLPPGMNKKNKKINPETTRFAMLAMTPDVVNIEINKLKSSARTKIMADVLSTLLKSGGTLPVAEISQKSSIKSLENKGLITIEEVAVSRSLLKEKESFDKKKPRVSLTDDQQGVVDKVIESDKNFFLLHGVTGSGKTEVYLKIIEHSLSLGKSAIILVPEISLTPQTVSRFYDRFGDKVAILHSSLSVKERKNEWYKIYRGECDIVVGARSALYAPIKNLGVVIIDEEHDSSYKQESNPRYHAVTVAGWLTKQVNAKLILGSATPAVDHYYFAKNKVMELLELPNKVIPSEPSNLKIVDMREEYEEGYTGLFSRDMVFSIRESLKNNEQVMLLLNRRGFAPYVSCRVCGYKLKCPNCDVTMTLHNDNALYCHYCGEKRSNRPICPECSSNEFKYQGTGTQKVEEEIRSFCPKARVLRMDRDSTKKFGSMEAIIAKFAAGEADILLGTQMIAKGHDFDNVGLVGVVSADTALNLPDFRSAERTFSLLMQVAGRTGRRGVSGKVIVQTFEPDNYAISLIKSHDYKEFYDKEIAYRKALSYPPFSRMCRILLQSKFESKINEVESLIDNYIETKKPEDVEVFGPIGAPIPKIASKHRWHIIIKSPNVQKIHLVVKSIVAILNKKIEFSVDVDPMSTL